MRHALKIALAAAAMALTACASTTLRDSWADPSYSSGPFRKVMVVGVSANPVNRRVFEDGFAAKLTPIGVQAVRSYTVLPQPGMIPQQDFDSAAKASGADALLMVHLLRVDTKTQVVPVSVPVSGVGYYGMYRGWTTVPEVTQYDLATVETNVFEVKTDKLVWSGITETFNPNSVAAETPGFADVIIKALSDRGLLPKAISGAGDNKGGGGGGY
jgi:hypothetical protein